MYDITEFEIRWSKRYTVVQMWDVNMSSCTGDVKEKLVYRLYLVSSVEQFAYRKIHRKLICWTSQKMFLSIFVSVLSLNLSVDLIHKHDMLDSGQVWELMSWNRSRDLVFTIASGSRIKDCVFVALLILQGLSSMPVCESHLVMRGAYKESFNQEIVWGEFF